MNKFRNYSLFGVLLLAFGLRVFTLSRLMVFTPDEEYLLYIAQTLVRDFHIIWIGVSALGLNFYMGPFWIYFIYPFVGIFNGDPLVLGIINSLFGVGTVFLLYIVGSRLFNKNVGLVAALMYATSSLLVFYDQQGYPPIVPFLSLLMFLCIWMSKYSKKWWILFSFLYGLVFHIHLSLFLVVFVAIYWIFRQRSTVTRGIVIYCLSVFLISISPLIAFDYFHKASNVTVVFRIVQTFGKSKSNVNFLTRANNLSQAFGRVFYLNHGTESSDEILYPCMINSLTTTTRVNLFFSMLIIFLFVGYFLRQKKLEDDRSKLLFAYSLSFLIPFLFMSIFNPIEYYLLGFFPILFLVVSIVIDRFNLKFKYVFYLVIFLLAINNIYSVFNSKGSFGLDSKKKLISEINKVIGNRPFELNEAGQCHGYGGFRYLFKTYSNKPVKSGEDSNFSWLWPDEITNIRPEYEVLITETRANPKIDKGYIKVIKEGGFSAYIYYLK